MLHFVELFGLDLENFSLGFFLIVPDFLLDLFEMGGFLNLFVGALFCDLPLVDDVNVVEVFQIGQSVGDNNSSFIFQVFLEALFHD